VGKKEGDGQSFGWKKITERGWKKKASSCIEPIGEKKREEDNFAEPKEKNSVRRC